MINRAVLKKAHSQYSRLRRTASNRYARPINGPGRFRKAKSPKLVEDDVATSATV